MSRSSEGFSKGRLQRGVCRLAFGVVEFGQPLARGMRGPRQRLQDVASCRGGPRGGYGRPFRARC
eukprot:5733259-Pyramimonas_sp.AAC.1